MITVAHVEDNRAKAASLVGKSSRHLSQHCMDGERRSRNSGRGCSDREEPSYVSVTSGHGSNDLPFSPLSSLISSASMIIGLHAVIQVSDNRCRFALPYVFLM